MIVKNFIIISYHSLTDDLFHFIWCWKSEDEKSVIEYGPPIACLYEKRVKTKVGVANNLVTEGKHF